MGGGKKKTRRHKGGRGKKNWWDKNSDSAWVGKYRILVKAYYSDVKADFLVVDLKQQMIVTKHPEGVLLNDEGFISTAVLDKGTLSVFNICFHNETPPIYGSNRCTSSTLDLTKTPPIWSNWAPVPEMNTEWIEPYVSVLDNKIFVFDDSLEVYQIGATKWENITVPYDGPKYKPISDPNKNRLIAYGDDYLYAYYPNIEKWELLHQQKLSDQDNYLLNQFHLRADQVVAENLILGFNSEDQIFMAHNILTNKWLHVDSKFDFEIQLGDFSQLVHLGNDILCLADTCQIYPDVKTVLKFLRFSVKLVEEEDRVRLTPLSFHPILIYDDIRSMADTFIPF